MAMKRRAARASGPAGGVAAGRRAGRVRGRRWRGWAAAARQIRVPAQAPHSTKEIYTSTIRGTRKKFFWCTLAARVLRLRGQGSFPFEVAVGLFTDEGIVLAGSYHFELGRWLQ